MEKSPVQESVNEADEEIILSTTEKEIIVAIMSSNYTYLEDLGGLDFNINFKISQDGMNPLLLAASIGSMAIVQMILANQSVRLNHSDNKGENAIFYATAAGHLKIVKELQKRGWHLSLGKYSKNHPAHIACANGRLNMLEYFIGDLSLDPNLKKANGLTMLMIACMKKFPEITKYLLEHNADPNVTLEDGTTALYLAAKSGWSKSVELLLSYTKEVDVICGKSQSTPLMAAINAGSLDAVKSLLIAKANINIWNTNGEDAYVLASIGPNVDVLKIILAVFMSNGNSIDKESPLDKFTMFMRAALGLHSRNAKYLKRKGAAVNHKNSDGESALHIALKQKHKKAIALCLFLGANK